MSEDKASYYSRLELARASRARKHGLPLEPQAWKTFGPGEVPVREHVKRYRDRLRPWLR